MEKDYLPLSMEENLSTQTENKESFKFVDTQATAKIFKLKKRIRAVCGGTSASKTISILVYIIDWCQSKTNKRYDVMSESYPHLEDGAIKDFQNIMIDRGYWEDSRWNGTKHFYTFETGTVLKFISVDKLGKAHGPRRDGLYVNEANNIPFQIYDQLEVRTNDIVIIDWNPSVEFWYNTEIEGKLDHDFLRLTYLDCLNALRAETIASIESKKNRKNWWRVYGLGLLGETEGKIYKGWKEIDEIPHGAKLVRRWLDFGYTNDPTAAGNIYEYDGGYILDEFLYTKGLSNSKIADVIVLQNEEEKILTVADSSEPKSIDEIAAYNVLITGCEKGPGSISRGIDVVGDQKISYTKRSRNIHTEYMNYVYKVDKRTGETLNVAEEGFDHHMDGIRYAIADMVNARLKASKTNTAEFYERLRYKKRGTEKGVRAGLR